MEICEYCGEWFEETGRQQETRRMYWFCSESHRTMAYIKRKKLENNKVP